MTTSRDKDASSTPFGFGAFVPGFDFLQNLTKGAAQGLPQIPGLANWVAPTLNVEDIDKRIQELKSVQFWLEQNARALSATVQALEVQKLTLATLKGMNVSAADLAKAFTPKAPAAAAPSPAAPSHTAATPPPAPAPAAAASAAAGTPAAASLVDPAQWWSALTQQFQQIAASALSDVGKAAASAQAAAAARKPASAGKAAAAPAAKTAAPGKKAAPSTARRKAG